MEGGRMSELSSVAIFAHTPRSRSAPRPLVLILTFLLLLCTAMQAPSAATWLDQPEEPADPGAPQPVDAPRAPHEDDAPGAPQHDAVPQTTLGGFKVAAAAEGPADPWAGWNAEEEGRRAPPGPPPMPKQPSPWSMVWGLDRLKSEHLMVQHAFPEFLRPSPDMSPMEGMRAALDQHGIRRPDVEDRKILWMQHQDLVQECPSWLTLKPDQQLQCWEKVLVDDLDLDDFGTGGLVELIRQGRLGYQEGCRIIAHLLKDREEEWKTSPSRWLCKVAEESREAVQKVDIQTLEPPRSSWTSTRPSGSSWSSSWHGGAGAHWGASAWGSSWSDTARSSYEPQ